VGIQKPHFHRFPRREFKIGYYDGYRDSTVEFERVGSGRASRVFWAPLLPTITFIPTFYQRGSRTESQMEQE